MIIKLKTIIRNIKLFGIFALSGCVNSLQSNINEHSMMNALSGKWGWESDQCSSDSYIIFFTSKGAEMHLIATQSPYTPSSTVIEPTKFSYNIKSFSSQSLAAEPITEKKEYSDIGELIIWEIRLIGENGFCWHRSDWGENACTTSMLKCN